MRIYYFFSQNRPLQFDSGIIVLSIPTILLFKILHLDYTFSTFPQFIFKNECTSYIQFQKIKFRLYELFK